MYSIFLLKADPANIKRYRQPNVVFTSQYESKLDKTKCDHRLAGFESEEMQHPIPDGGHEQI